ncbi:cytochrome P450 76T24-like [Malania oleifera]|uniref:cytochrome P450 76T24-like n=1 Tax=Malania oleifera TaxID=397392 RepID=UPI0025ADE239|nr:cytochrome P450 76T24-like [Malania oleifera]XP_057980161.1 cytochrome P450 76T24-like [Malania oleifera]
MDDRPISQKPQTGYKLLGTDISFSFIAPTKLQLHPATPMDNLTVLLLVALSIAWIFIHAFKSFRLNSNPANPLPPGPPRLPLLGNLPHLRGGSPYQNLSALAKTYGPVMSLKLGTLTTVVFSTADAAREALSKHDALLSDRVTRHVSKVLDHNKVSLILSPVSDRWRNLRKILTLQMFVTQRLNAGEDLRLKRVQQLREHLQESCSGGASVDVSGAVFTTLLNMTSNALFSVDLAGYGSEESREFERIIFGVMEESASPNVADFFPVLRWMDPHGRQKKVRMHFEKFMGVLDEIINQRREERGNSMGNNTMNDVADALLDPKLEKDCGISLNDIRHLFMDVFLAGIDTCSSMLEWAMAELLHNPEKLAKARAELQEVLGKEGQIQESNISKLPYLQAVVKETLRLHPPGPLLLPHKAKANVEIYGFEVPKNAQILVNVWAINRDPNSWSNPNSFSPERFLESKIDYRGQNFEFLPFGSGRRMCPGLPLAHRMMHMILATFLYFDWKLDEGMKPQDMDMNERNRVTLLRRAQRLRAVPIKG